MVGLVHDVDVAGGVRRHPEGISELPVAVAGRAPLGEVGACVGEFLDAVEVEVRDVDVSGSVRRHSERIYELPVAEALRAPLGQIGAAAGELLDAVEGSVQDVDVAGRIRRHPGGLIELPVAVAGRAPLGEIHGRLCARHRRQDECAAQESESDSEAPKRGIHLSRLRSGWPSRRHRTVVARARPDAGNRFTREPRWDGLSREGVMLASRLGCQSPFSWAKGGRLTYPAPSTTGLEAISRERQDQAAALITWRIESISRSQPKSRFRSSRHWGRQLATKSDDLTRGPEGDPQNVNRPQPHHDACSRPASLGTPAPRIRRGCHSPPTGRMVHGWNPSADSCGISLRLLRTAHRRRFEARRPSSRAFGSLRKRAHRTNSSAT